MTTLTTTNWLPWRAHWCRLLPTRPPTTHPPPPGLSFNNPGPAWSEPVGDRSTRNHGPPARFGEFVMAATAVTKFGANETHVVKIIDERHEITLEPHWRPKLTGASYMDCN
ncbi:BQ5605_C006g03928 [Microbotryum silenes-dioicae]|uniref:BQ5605_C006g03928 protein n=1 Tax=Microbotryum silenes-dioicae TaxID=796604 RepID=A0A2X0MSM7_9BASI|nr:BQ5605_C006g03928 [Microbotryum silenes-dioicae]